MMEADTGEHGYSPDFLIIGQGEIGEKAQQLMDKTPVLRRLGFRAPRRTILAERWFDDFFQRNGLGENLRDITPSEDIQGRIRRGSLTLEQFSTLEQICGSYGDTPLVVRSSAKGDARGTGTYLSVFSENQSSEVRKALQAVLASYFSPDAIAFRRDAQTGEGFGIIIEPIIGLDIDGAIAPILSGFGYTSTSRGEGYINVVPGLGCGVESRDGERISRGKFIENEGDVLGLAHYIYLERTSMFDGEKALKRSALLRTDKDSNRHYSGQVFFPRSKYDKARVRNTTFDYPREIERVLNSVNFLPVFSSMQQMEQIFGKPQYFEWAMTTEAGRPVFWIVQIADVNQNVDSMEFGNFGHVMFEGHTVTGTGEKEATKIVDCWNSTDIDALHQFNQHNQGYVLLFSSRVTRRVGTDRKLGYSDFSNASVFLEIQDAHHVGDPVAHLGGQLDMTGKLFAVLDYDAENPPDFDMFHKRGQTEDGLRVFHGQIKVIASEKKNRMVVYVADAV